MSFQDNLEHVTKLGEKQLREAIDRGLSLPDFITNPELPSADDLKRLYPITVNDVDAFFEEAQKVLTQ